MRYLYLYQIPADPIGCSPDNDLGQEEEKAKKTDWGQMTPANVAPGQSPEKDEVDERCGYPTTESMRITLKREVQPQIVVQNVDTPFPTPEGEPVLME